MQNVTMQNVVVFQFFFLENRNILHGNIFFTMQMLCFREPKMGVTMQNVVVFQKVGNNWKSGGQERFKWCLHKVQVSDDVCG